MVYALVRGWLAGMAAAFLELVLAAMNLLPGYSSPISLDRFAIPFSAIVLVSVIEESTKLLSLRGIAEERFPFFRNALFKGILVGTGFALFEVGMKILFHDDTTDELFLSGAASATLLHLATGTLIGLAWLFRLRRSAIGLFWALFAGAILVHIAYNAFLSPFLFSHLSR